MIFSYSVSDPIKSHAYCSGYFFAVTLKMLFAAILSLATSVGGCGCTISAREVGMVVDFWEFSNNPPNSASMAYAMTFHIMIHSTCTGPF